VCPPSGAAAFLICVQIVAVLVSSDTNTVVEKLNVSAHSCAWTLPWSVASHSCAFLVCVQIVAVLVFSDTNTVVEKLKSDGMEAPLLATFDGVEFPSTDRPVRLVHGRASFKLKISQVPSLLCCAWYAWYAWYALVRPVCLVHPFQD